MEYIVALIIGALAALFGLSKLSKKDEAKIDSNVRDIEQSEKNRQLVKARLEEIRNQKKTPKEVDDAFNTDETFKP